VSSSTSIQICCFYAQVSGQLPSFNESIGESLNELLPVDRYTITTVYNVEAVIELLTRKHGQDCLLIWGQPDVVIQNLEKLGICLPTVAILEVSTSANTSSSLTTSDIDFTSANLTGKNSTSFNDLLQQYLKEFSNAIVSIDSDQLSEKLSEAIDQAIATFLKLSPYLKCNLPITPTGSSNSQIFVSVAAQQQRLAEKLKARLGYLGVYYKRDPKQFLRHLSEEDKQDYLNNLNQIYHSIILEYFKDRASTINQLIDEFANLAFFGDVSVSQVLEIHMNLMDEFSKQLKLEGRSEEVLMDYRIALIDVIAHLCEMYRRSVPRTIDKPNLREV
jgi:circadian clock protein KaiA